MSIGFFDSGVGGLTVLKQAINIMPDEDYIFYADTDNVPYGQKSKEEVKEHVIRAADFIINKGVDVLVIACNTATSVVVEDLREKYDIPIVGMEPAVKPAIERNSGKNKRVLVFATKLTLSEKKFNDLIKRIDNQQIIDSIPLPGLVTFAENSEFREGVIEEYILDSIKNIDIYNYSTIVLGCTHFVYYKNILKKILPADIDIIDGNDGTVKNLKKIIESRIIKHSGSGKITFYESGREVTNSHQLAKYNELLAII